MRNGLYSGEEGVDDIVANDRPADGNVRTVFSSRVKVIRICNFLGYTLLQGA